MFAATSKEGSSTPVDLVEAGVVAVIPAFQADRELPYVLSKLRHYLPMSSVVVVDDGSTDDTHEVAVRYGCQTVRHQQNLGKGRALRSGFVEALKMGAQLVLTLDADGQHDPSSVPRLHEAMQQGGWDIVIGCRNRNSGMPLGRRASNWLNSALVTAFTGQPVPDSQSGFRLIRSDLLRRVSPRSERYEFETELLLAAAAAGFRIGSVKIPTIYGGQASHIRPSDTLRFLRLYLTRLLRLF